MYPPPCRGFTLLCKVTLAFFPSQLTSFMGWQSIAFIKHFNVLASVVSLWMWRRQMFQIYRGETQLRKAECFVQDYAGFQVDDAMQWFRFLADCFFVIYVYVHVLVCGLKC